MVNDLEKSNSSMSIELGESKKMIESLQGEKEELQQWEEWLYVMDRQKAKMESLYLALKKQQKQSTSDSPVSTPPILGFPIMVTLQNRANNKNENNSPIPQEANKFKGILVPVCIVVRIHDRNLLNDPIPQDSFQALRRRTAFVNYDIMSCLCEQRSVHIER